MRAVGCDAVRLKSIGDIRAETVPTKYPNRGPIVKQMRNAEDWRWAIEEYKRVIGPAVFHSRQGRLLIKCTAGLGRE